MTGQPIPASLADRTQRQSFAQSALVAGSLLLLATMLGGWLFDVGQTLMLAASLVIVLLTLGGGFMAWRLARCSGWLRPWLGLAARRGSPVLRPAPATSA